MTATEAKAKLLALLADVEQGQVIEITRRGRTVAQLAPARGPHALKGRFAHIAQSNASDDELFTTGVAWNLR
jgi:prevent-host-death family protein